MTSPSTTFDDGLLAWFAGAGDESNASDEHGTVAAFEAFEARLFDDPAFAAQCARLLDMRDALRALAAQGALVPIVRAAELRALSQTTKVTEHYAREGRIESHITDEEFIAAHVPVAPSARDDNATRRVHVEFCTVEGFPYFRVNEAPFDPESGEIILLCKAHVALAQGALRVRVIDDDARILAEVAIENRA